MSAVNAHTTTLLIGGERLAVENPFPTETTRLS